ncbi:MAG: hypothetical protein C4345_13895, partial [Chloroflexota bacterium]
MVPIRIGVAGVTHPHAPAHLRNLELMDEIEGVVLYDEDARALAPLRERPKVLAVTTSLEELVRRDDVPVLLSLLRHDQAASAILRMVRAGKHVIAEKPVTRMAAELEVILDVAARSGVQVGAFYQNRWHPAAQAEEVPVGFAGSQILFDSAVPDRVTGGAQPGDNGTLHSLGQASALRTAVGGVVVGLGAAQAGVAEAVEMDRN